MNLRNGFIVFFLAIGSSIYGQEKLPDTDIYLLGDAGEGLDLDFSALKSQLDSADENSFFILLGDNIYPAGLPSESDSNHNEMADKLGVQLELARNFKGQTILIPGNHDWNRMKAGGRERVLAMEKYAESYFPDKNKVKAYPGNACGDPKAVKVHKDLVFFFIDSQWWLQRWDKEANMNKGCNIKTKAAYFQRLKELFDKHRNDQILVFMHHPHFSNGQHGGQYSWKEHIFPLRLINHNLWIPMPIIGSILPLGRQAVPSRQDIAHTLYQELLDGLEKASHFAKNVSFIAGHEHGMQHHYVDERNYIVAGSGSKATFVRESDKSEFVAQTKGFAHLRVSGLGKTVLRFFSYENELLYHNILFHERTQAAVLAKNDPMPAFAKAAAQGNYNIGKAAQLWLGSGYRAAWATEINLPTLDLESFDGGLTPVNKGGGMASNSLRLENKEGKQYVIRSVDKDLSKILPENMNGIKAGAIVKDQSSANFPYGPLIVKSLSDDLNIPHTNPLLFFVPKQAALGAFLSDFGGELYWLEERPSGSGEESPHFAHAEKLMGFHDLMANLNEKSKHRVDQQAVLRARIFDLFIHDWDRHDDQWRWASFKEDDQTIYKPIPRDRDQAFYKMNGILPTLAYTFAEHKFKPFKSDLKDVKGHSFNGRHFDRYFLNEMSWKDWERAVKKLEKELTTERIELAVKALPSEIYTLDGMEIQEKLEIRKTNLLDISKKLYDYISTEVHLSGTNDPDYFECINTDSGFLVTRYRFRDGKKKDVRYRRLFKAKETKIVRVFGLDGKDYYDYDETLPSKIKVYFYDEGENDGADIEQVPFDRYSFQYDKTFPTGSANYTYDDGLWLGLGFTKTSHRFNTTPFRTKQRLLVQTALGSREAFGLYYDRETNGFLHPKISLSNELSIETPSYMSYYGLGNKSLHVIDDKRFHWVRLSHHQWTTQLNWYSALRRRKLSIGPVAEAFKVHPFEGRVADEEGSVFVSENYDYSYYLGGEAGFSYRQLNHENDPTAGIKLSTSFSYKTNIQSSNALSQFKVSFTNYQTFGRTYSWVLATRLGYERTDGQAEIFQLNRLGGNSYLRGWRNDRFIGDQMAYGNIEGRFPLFKSPNLYLPFTASLAVGGDIGRVWLDGENDSEWHQSWSAGISLRFLDLIRLSSYMSFSKENTLFGLSTGWFF